MALSQLKIFENIPVWSVISSMGMIFNFRWLKEKLKDIFLLSGVHCGIKKTSESLNILQIHPITKLSLYGSLLFSCFIVPYILILYGKRKFC